MDKMFIRVEVRDGAGRVIGTYLQPVDPDAFEGLEPPISKEEIQRRKQSTAKTYSTAEVLAHLASS